MKRASDRIFFVRAKATIEKNCYPELDRVLDILQADSTLHLHIEGHTDSEGTDARNAALSLRRAKAVKKWLVSKGIPAARLDTEAYGSKRPLADNSTPEGMAQNRRVEMVLTNYKP
jgi:outer membrane protein OmpA-like peptidoglycan-associated protein